jgi:hypothetical protein
MPKTSDTIPTTENGLSRLTVRFGDEILQAGFTTVPNLLLRYQVQLDITSTELNFILQVWYHWWEDKDPYPALSTIAQRMGASRRQVRRYSEGLRGKGLLVAHDRRQDGLGQVTSEYDFSRLLERLRELYRDEVAVADRKRQTDRSITPRTKMSEGGRTKTSEAPRTPVSSEDDEENEDSEYQLNSNTSKLQNGNSGNSRLSRSTTFSIKLKGRRSEDEEDEAQPVYQQVTLSQNGHSPTRVGELLEKRKPELARGTRRKLDPQIRQLITQYSEWGDPALKSNVTQARRLFDYSQLSANDFVSLLYEARSITKQDGRSARNKMAYYFAVLRDLVGVESIADEQDDEDID